MRTLGAAAATEIAAAGRPKCAVKRARRLARAGVFEAQHHRERLEDVVHVGWHAEQADLLRMMFGDFREHREHGATAERMTDHRVYGRVRAQHFGEAVAKARQVREAPGRCAMRGRIDADHREAGRAQRRDETAETRGMTSPAVQQHDPRARGRPSATREFVGAAAQRDCFWPARRWERRPARPCGAAV